MSTFETLAKGKLLSKQTVRLRDGQEIEVDIHEWEIDTIGFQGYIFHDGQWIAVKAVFVENEAMNRLNNPARQEQHDREVLEEKARWLRIQRDNGEQ